VCHVAPHPLTPSPKGEGECFFSKCGRRPHTPKAKRRALALRGRVRSPSSSSPEGGMSFFLSGGRAPTPPKRSAARASPRGRGGEAPRHSPLKRGNVFFLSGGCAPTPPSKALRASPTGSRGRSPLVIQAKLEKKKIPPPRLAGRGSGGGAPAHETKTRSARAADTKGRSSESKS